MNNVKISVSYEAQYVSFIIYIECNCICIILSEFSNSPMRQQIVSYKVHWGGVVNNLFSEVSSDSERLLYLFVKSYVEIDLYSFWYSLLVTRNLDQQQPSRAVLRKRRSENI